ncbi:hypothetical protein GOODEAATRI_026730, partial [Goodea atripinnis]
SFSTGSIMGRSDPVLSSSYSLPAMPSFSMAASLPMQFTPKYQTNILGVTKAASKAWEKDAN